jgi:tetratricopeptide (TPR) repeat protein
VWFGLDQVQTRLESVWTGVAFEESRKELWSDILPIAKDFPLIGSGYGTFQHVEPLYRTRPSNTLNEHAHNEYLEALIEGGLPRLGLMALAIWFTFQLGFRALVRLEGSPLSGLVMGALFGCAAAVIHSVGEFGIHVPAIAIIVAVLAAHLCALGSSDWTSQTGKPAAPDAGPFSATYTLRLGGVAPVTASVAALLLGVSLVSQSWTAARVQLFRRAAWSSNVVTSIEDPREREILYLGAAARLAPDYARLYVDLAQAQQDAFEEKITALEENAELDDEAITAERERLTRVHLVPALRHYLRARDLCPLLGQPHLRIAENVQSLDSADPATAYLDRAKLLIPFDPELWYICGVQELFDNQPDKAWKSWRHSLELSDLYFSEIVRAGSAVLGTEGLLTQVLPEKPALLARAADLLYPNSEDAGHREPLLSKAQSLLRQQPPNQMDAEQWHIEAIIARSRKQVPEAIDAYRAALARRPTEVEWRYELADSLFQGGKIDESHRELVTILRQRPDHTQARQLYEVVSHQRAVQR